MCFVPHTSSYYCEFLNRLKFRVTYMELDIHSSNILQLERTVSTTE
jgi:hypothetical protein